MLFKAPILALLATAVASPISLSTTTTFAPSLFSRTSPASSQASDVILAIMPTSADCSSATGPYASDCRTANQSAPHFIAAMQRHNLLHVGQIAAVLALTGFESVDLKYKHNVYPGRPGQGTSAMLMPPNVLAYAQSIPELAGGLQAAGGDPVKVLELVADDEWNFGAAAWYVTNNAQCKQLGVAEALISASDVAWGTYMQCVGVDQNDQDRRAYWERAKAAFGLPLATDPPKKE